MLALPLARMSAHEYERQRGAEPLARARVRRDQERQPFDGGVAADIDEDRSAAAEGSEVLVAVGDAAGAAALVPAARLFNEPAPPEREPLLAGKRARRELLQLDPARQAAKPP